ncbi:MAG TPA: hypothetical protein VEH76_13470 [Methylocystis sp.]|nr:hypothetical protein [Methylocystis sp.]
MTSEPSTTKSEKFISTGMVIGGIIGAVCGGAGTLMWLGPVAAFAGAVIVGILCAGLASQLN